ncbi:MAG: hypothetical protein KDD42_02375 [Bdellovibrionales bacterium]|nr:hypothetical protein [Bdellovibrionales bacterium]
MSKPRLAWFSELNCGSVAGSTSSAYISDQILDYLRNDFEIELFHNSLEDYRDFRTSHFLTAFKRHAQKPFDLFFYQVEDRSSADWLRVHLGAMPGVVWFHDFLFSRTTPHALSRSPWQETVAAFNLTPEKSIQIELDQHLALHEAAFALMALFSDERQHDLYRRSLAPRIQVDLQPRSYYLPFPVACSTGRQVENVAAESLAFCGSPLIEDRSHIVLEALMGIEDCPELLWLIDENEKPEALKILNEFGIKNCQLIIGRSPQRWQEILTTARIALHPLFSMFGSTAPYLQISFGAGVPVIVTDFGSSDYLPDNLVFKVEQGVSEVYQLRSIISELSRRDFAVLKSELVAYCRENFEVELVAKQLVSVLHEGVMQLRPFYAKWSDFLQMHRARLVRSSASYLRADRERRDSPLSADFIERKLLVPAFNEFGWVL